VGYEEGLGRCLMVSGLQELVVTESGLRGGFHGYCYLSTDGADRIVMRGGNTQRLAFYCSSS
jgi:hypothetical protein